MSPALIHKEFDRLLRTGAEGCRLRRSIGMSAKKATWYRYRIKQYNDVSLDIKVKWLRLAGYDINNEPSYSRKEMLAFGQFCTRYSNREAHRLGMPYVLEKFEAHQQPSP